MIVKVNQLAFKQPQDEERFRPVTIKEGLEGPEILNEIYHQGQNCVQPVEGYYSVSVGDVIVTDRQYFFVDCIGFKEISETEYNNLREEKGVELV